MEVKEVIEKLKEFDPEAELCFECDDCFPKFYMAVEVIEKEGDDVVIKQYF